MNQNLYEILGVSPTATPVEIKKAYKRLAKIFHPDINRQNGSEEIFKQITYAYSVLSDSRKRFGYDSKLIKENLLNGIEVLKPLLSAIVRFNIKGAIDEVKRLILRYNAVIVDVRLEEGEIARHTDKIALISVMETCPDCLGYNKSCSRCGGSGKSPTQRRINIKIPANSLFDGFLDLPEGIDTYLGRRKVVARLASNARNIYFNSKEIFVQFPTKQERMSKRLNIEILGRMLEVSIPENIGTMTVLRLKRWFDNRDINIRIESLLKENNRCVG